MEVLNKISFQRKLKILTISIGIIYFVFGLLKFFPQLSPAESIGCDTVEKLTFGLLPPGICILGLAALEVAIGISLISGKWLKIAVPAAILHLIFTFTPFIFFPEIAFGKSALSPSLLGQYILKNIILISALFLIYPNNSIEKASE